jgi:hypothetical protein
MKKGNDWKPVKEDQECQSSERLGTRGANKRDPMKKGNDWKTIKEDQEDQSLERLGKRVGNKGDQRQERDSRCAIEAKTNAGTVERYGNKLVVREYKREKRANDSEAFAKEVLESKTNDSEAFASSEDGVCWNKQLGFTSGARTEGEGEASTRDEGEEYEDCACDEDESGIEHENCASEGDSGAREYEDSMSGENRGDDDGEHIQGFMGNTVVDWGDTDCDGNFSADEVMGMNGMTTSACEDYVVKNEERIGLQ